MKFKIKFGLDENNDVKITISSLIFNKSFILTNHQRNLIRDFFEYYDDCEIEV